MCAIPRYRHDENSPAMEKARGGSILRPSPCSCCSRSPVQRASPYTKFEDGTAKLASDTQQMKLTRAKSCCVVHMIYTMQRASPYTKFEDATATLASDAEQAKLTRAKSCCVVHMIYTVRHRQINTLPTVCPYTRPIHCLT